MNLSGQTSASYNMRVNYERCLLEFEHYISNGQYLADLAASKAPSPDHVQHAPPSKQRESSIPQDNRRLAVQYTRASCAWEWPAAMGSLKYIRVYDCLCKGVRKSFSSTQSDVGLE